MRHEGVRRLSLLLGILATIPWLVSALPEYQSLRERKWHYDYFMNQWKAHPAAELISDSHEAIIALVEAEFNPPSAGDRSRILHNIYRFPHKPVPYTEFVRNGDPVRVTWAEEFVEGTDQKPTLSEYLSIPLKVLGAFFAPWLFVRAVGWVVAGFRS